MKLRKFAMMIGMCAAFAVGPVASVLAKEAPPETTPEGLVLQKNTKSRIVYMKPGATFAQYNRVAILECLVDFEKDWQKDYNNSRRGLEGRVSDKDVERMKTGLAAEFKKVFTDELQNKGGYQVVGSAAPDVLVLRPALLNVEVYAPDIMTAGINATVRTFGRPDDSVPRTLGLNDEHAPRPRNGCRSRRGCVRKAGKPRDQHAGGRPHPARLGA